MLHALVAPVDLIYSSVSDSHTCITLAGKQFQTCLTHAAKRQTA